MDGFFYWDVLESIVKVPVPLYNNPRLFYDLNLVFIHNGDAVVITELSNGDKRCTVEVVENMSVGCQNG